TRRCTGDAYVQSSRPHLVREPEGAVCELVSQHAGGNCRLAELLQIGSLVHLCEVGSPILGVLVQKVDQVPRGTLVVEEESTRVRLTLVYEEAEPPGTARKPLSLW